MRCAVVQMNSVKDVDTNLKCTYEFIALAAKQQCRLVVLPEMFACIGVKNQSDLATSRFHKQDVLLVLANWAKEFSIYIVAGSLPFNQTESIDNSKVLASCFVFSPNAEILSRYDKIHLFDVNVADEKGSYRESDTFQAGNKPQTVMCDNKRLGLSICYDLRFPELFQVYQQAHCDLITVPSAFTYQTGKKHWATLLQARAIETQSFVLAANQVGIHEDGRKTWGHSMIVGPDGDILAEVKGEKTGLAIADLDFNLIQQCRINMPLLAHKRL